MHEVLPASPIHSLSHAELIAYGLTYQPDTFTPISVGLIACSRTYQPNTFTPISVGLIACSRTYQSNTFTPPLEKSAIFL